MINLDDLKGKTNKEIYAKILLTIYQFIPIKSNLTNEEYDIEIIKKLKFTNIGDNKKLRSCIDLIEDTESATIEFFVNGLYHDTRKFGEMYLRLYGILNTISLQIEAIIELIELFKVPHKTILANQLKKTKAYEVRNKVASHTVAYNDSQHEIVDSFRVTQISLSKWGHNISIVSNVMGYEEINLIRIIETYNSNAEEILKKICNKAITSLFKNHSEQKQYLLDLFEFVQNRRFDYKNIQQSF